MVDTSVSTAPTSAGQAKPALCHTCQTSTASFLCSKCQTTAYCSRECQVKDWKSHKKQCSVRAVERQMESLKADDAKTDHALDTKAQADNTVSTAESHHTLNINVSSIKPASQQLYQLTPSQLQAVVQLITHVCSNRQYIHQYCHQQSTSVNHLQQLNTVFHTLLQLCTFVDRQNPQIQQLFSVLYHVKCELMYTMYKLGDDVSVERIASLKDNADGSQLTATSNVTSHHIHTLITCVHSFTHSITSLDYYHQLLNCWLSVQSYVNALNVINSALELAIAQNNQQAVDRYTAVKQYIETQLQQQQQQRSEDSIDLYNTRGSATDADVNSYDQTQRSLQQRGVSYKLLPATEPLQQRFNTLQTQWYKQYMQDQKIRHLEVRYTTDYGRAVYTTRSLTADQIIMIELPTVSMSLFHYNSCSICYRFIGNVGSDNEWQYCRNGCKMERYCSSNCEATAWQSYHQSICHSNLQPLYERISHAVTGSAKIWILMCKAIGMIMNRLQQHLQSTHTETMLEQPLKQISQVVEQLQCNDKKTTTTNTDIPTNIDTLLSLSLQALQPLTLCPELSFVQSLTDLPPSHLQTFSQSYDTLYSMYTLLQKLLNLQHNYYLTYELFESLYTRLLINTIGCQVSTDSEKEGQYVELGGSSSVIAPMMTLVNHSCLPNCTIDTHLRQTQGKIRLRSLRPIRKNEQLTISYIDSNHLNRDSRAIQLLQYGFRCRCRRCQQETMSEKTDQLLQQHGL